MKPIIPTEEFEAECGDLEAEISIISHHLDIKKLLSFEIVVDMFSKSSGIPKCMFYGLSPVPTPKSPLADLNTQ
jgi:hypothetical protein